MARFARNGRARAAVAVATAPVRCAIYCRVSSDERLGQQFNSLHAQRESGESYVASHRGEGWVALADDYGDPGFTGGNTNRPGLQRLLADIEAGKVDVVIVYKLDRLSRSMRDFLNLLDFFERHDVSFVSVSQAFDTSTPIGKMTLNLLASFGEFERQIIAERTRDKLGAARRRGKYVGGYPVLGYDRDPKGGRLVLNQDEARMVREIFQLFLEKRSLTTVLVELARQGLTLKRWTTKDGKQYGGGAFKKHSLRHLLTNYTYLGKVNFQGSIYEGEHEPIVSHKIFREVQRILEANRRDAGSHQRNRHGALLRGLIYCAACGTVMAHAPVKKNGRLFRYYRCTHSIRNGAAACPSRPISADRVEAFIVDEIRRIGADHELQSVTFEQALAQLKAQARGLRAERKRIERDIVTTRGEVQRLVGAVSRVTGTAADAIAAELAKAQERFAMLEARQREIQEEIAGLTAQDINETDLARALEAFDPIWDVLLTPEKERVLRLLVERVSYDGSTGRLEIRWRLAGLGDFAREVEGG